MSVSKSCLQAWLSSPLSPPIPLSPPLSTPSPDKPVPDWVCRGRARHTATPGRDSYVLTPCYIAILLYYQNMPDIHPYICVTINPRLHSLSMRPIVKPCSECDHHAIIPSLAQPFCPALSARLLSPSGPGPVPPGIKQSPTSTSLSVPPNQTNYIHHAEVCKLSHLFVSPRVSQSPQ